MKQPPGESTTAKEPSIEVTNFFALAFPQISASNLRVNKASSRLISQNSRAHFKKLEAFVAERESKLPSAVLTKFQKSVQSGRCAHQRWLQVKRQEFEKRWFSQLASTRKLLARLGKIAVEEADEVTSTASTGKTSKKRRKTSSTSTAIAISNTSTKSKKLKASSKGAGSNAPSSSLSTSSEVVTNISFAGLPEDEARRLVWSHIACQQIPRLSKALHSVYSTRCQTAKKIANAAASLIRRQFTRAAVVGRPAAAGKRAMKEMLSFWRKNEREERDLRKRAEKEAQEKRRLEEEQREARRQAKKLNFLITQTELYSHFVGKKSTASVADKKPNTATTATAFNANTDFADVDDSVLQEEASRLAANAAAAHQARLAQFDGDKGAKEKEKEMDFMNPSTLQDAALLEQPSLLQVQLKSYQLKGLTWLASLYEQGINGILADEMGLGKTVQSISLLAHLAERQNNWGPFLIVTPASTLHNWQQEFSRFVPALKVIPYWGSVADRKVLRSTCMSYWTGKKPVTRDTPFHVMITSYQLIVSDEAFLQKVKWQYMILDEAQAIKSSQSIRWKTLLRFNCRNRLLLTGTPIQNSMQELWALLHFIMPTLFDSHDEFSEWFSKDIESHAENKGAGSLNAHQIQRLHMILKPFMLRRIKRDVQNELGAKIEKNIYCELSPRQRRLYRGLRDKLPLLELLRSGNDSALMNLVMQFRKICNHPELLERTEITSPLCFTYPDRLIGSLGNSSLQLLIRPHPGVVRFHPPRLVIEERLNPLSRHLLLDFNDREGAKCLDEIELAITLPSTDTSLFLSSRIPKAAPIKVLTRSDDAGDIFDTSSRSSNAYLVLSPSSCLADSINIPSMDKFIRDCGKLQKLDELLVEMNAGGHRVLLYNQMTRMIDLMEEYLQYRGYSYLRLDGSTNIGVRRDLVHAWQTDESIFVFLLSTRAGGLGINLTAADTVIFYDSDWNPTVDQQAMDRAHRLGQLKQVTVYRLITKGTIEERIQQRAKQKDEIHKVVIAGGSFGESEANETGDEKAALMSLLLEED